MTRAILSVGVAALASVLISASALAQTAAGDAGPQPAAAAPLAKPDPSAGRGAKIKSKPRRRSGSAHRRPRPSGPLARLDQANAGARDGPAAGRFVNSTLYYAYAPSRLYSLHTRPGYLTTIALRPGESLISKAAGDTVRWVLGETEAGVDGQRQTLVLIKPMRAGLRTNIVLTTDQRTYLIDAVSAAAPGYTSVVAWTYPQEEAKARAAAIAAAAAYPAPSAIPALPVDRLDFAYQVRVRKGRAPAWTPVRVFNDGAKTYIEFPPDVAVREAPPLFLLGDDDQVQLVIPRFSGRYLVVDRLIERAELRLGDKKPVVVRITRQGARS